MDSEILSPELLEELGGGDAILPASKNKRKVGKVIEETPEETAPLSKRAKKKIEQLKQKAEKEAKRSHYYEVLKNHTISDKCRSLLISSKDVSTVQSQSTKSRLKRAFDKHKLGLALDEDDQNLLFQTRSTISTEVPAASVTIDAPEKGNKPIPVVKTNSVASVSVPSPAVETPTVSCPDSKEHSATSLGSSLLSQFSKLKATLPKPPREVVTDTTGSALEEEEKRDSGPAYEPVEIDMPVDSSGRVKADMLNSGDKVQPPLPQRKRFLLDRDPDIQAARMLLPVCGMEQEIVEQVGNNDVIVLCGETGSGKSTQVPQFLYEAGYAEEGLIGVTQPRRVAAVSTARRVADEMGAPWNTDKKKRHSSDAGELVAYQIRHDSSTVGSSTKIKFMTDGILLKEISSDLLLRSYSAVLIDEAHERNVNTDVLIGMLSRTIPLRRQQHLLEKAQWDALSAEERDQYQPPIKPLRLIIMSATLRVQDFQSPRLFPSPPPVIKVEARQFPVTTHFSRKTETTNYLQECFRKTCLIHNKLPDGGILVFLTGKREILHMCRKLSTRLNRRYKGTAVEVEDTISKLIDAKEDGGGRTSRAAVPGLDDREHEADMWRDTSNEELLRNFVEDDSDESDDEELSDIEEMNEDTSGQDVDGKEDDEAALRSQLLQEVLGPKEGEAPNDNEDRSGQSCPPPQQTGPQRVHVLPLFAMLPAEQQKLVFQPPPPGHRLIVVATNVAETSITIPSIRYVVDCGRQKERVIDKVSGISRYEVTWISKASADQRLGRAGRTGPGHGYRLYSSAFYDQHMKMFQEPEICTTPLEDLILQLRSIGVDNEERFPFPTPPPLHALRRAYTVLTYIGALHSAPRMSHPVTAMDTMNAIMDSAGNQQATRPTASLTAIGKKIAKFPVNVRLAKMLIVSYKTGVLPLPLVTALIACVAERSPFNSQPAPINESHSDSDNDDEKESNKKEMWRHPNSDILARVQALGAFSYCLAESGALSKTSDDDGAVSKLCRKYALHRATLHRSLELQRQLHQLAMKILVKSGSKEEISGYDKLDRVPPPDAAQEVALRQILLTGSSDRIARKAPLGAIELAPGTSRRKRLTAYLCCDPAISTPVYIHPNSTLYRKDPTEPLPEYVVYNELISNQTGDTTYMSGVTVVSAAWIPELCRDCPLLNWLSPQDHPSPFFDLETDMIMCYVPSVYGVHRWQLPPVLQPLKHCCERLVSEQALNSSAVRSEPSGYRAQDEIYRWFGRLLLEGKVVTECGLSTVFKKDNMVEPLSVITERKPNKRVAGILQRLSSDGVFSRASLRSKLQQNSVYLSAEIQPFLKEECRKPFRKAWKAFSQLLD